MNFDPSAEHATERHVSGAFVAGDQVTPELVERYIVPGE